MIWKKKVLVGFLIMLFLIISGCSGGGTKQPKINKIDLGNLGVSFAQPSLYDHVMVWAGRTDGKMQDADTVLTIDIQSKEKKVIATSNYQNQPYIGQTNISENWITWLDSGITASGPEYALMAMNRQSGEIHVVQKFPGIVSNHRYLAWTSLEGDRFIWTQFSDQEHCLLKLMDLSTQETKIIATLHTTSAPAVNQSGNMVVWEEVLPNEWDGTIQTLDLLSGKTKDYPVSGAYAFPKINGNFILYSSQPSDSKPRNGLQLLDMNTGKITQFNVKGPYFWDIGNGMIAWSDYSQKDSKVFFKMLSQSNEQPIELGLGGLPYIYGNNIIWQSPKATNINITQIAF